MRARKLPRGIYRRGDVLWIRFKNAKGTLSRETTGQADIKVAEAILAKRRSEVAMLHHFPTRKFEQVGFDELLKAWEPTHVRKTPTFHYLLPRVRGVFSRVKAREVTTMAREPISAHAARAASPAPRLQRSARQQVEPSQRRASPAPLTVENRRSAHSSREKNASDCRGFREQARPLLADQREPRKHLGLQTARA